MSDTDFGPSTEDGVADGRQMILPHVDTSLDVANGRFWFKVTPSHLLVAIPVVAFFVTAIWSLNNGDLVQALLLMTATVGVGTAAGIAHYTSTKTMWPHERVLSGGRYLYRKFSMPWGYRKAVKHADELHGIKEIVTVDAGLEKEYAGVLSHDGRVSVPIRLNGSNTEHLSQDELVSTAMSLMKGVDSEITADGEPISIYATTRPWESPVAEQYIERAENLSKDNRLSPYLSGLLGDIGEWIIEEDDELRANDVEYYLVVSAREGTNGDSRPDAIKRRVKQGVNAMNRARHITPEAVSTHDVINICAEYWQSGSFPDTDVGESASDAALPAIDIEEEVDRQGGSTPAERALMPECVDEHSQYVRVGDSYARTYWISSWPEQPKLRFLHGLHTMFDVDMDTKFFLHPRDRNDTIENLKVDGAKIDSEGMDKSEEGSVETIKIDSDLDLYLWAYALLESGETNPWGLSGYVTVRAKDKDELFDACERVEKKLRDSPARTSPKAPFGDQLRAFRSTDPFGSDYYSGLGEKFYRATKTHLALGGAIGAMMPAASATLSEKGGARWGRDTSTGRMIQVDQFNQSTAGHTLTVAPTGGGKTVSSKQVGEELFKASDDLTLVACDTQGGFEDLVEAYDAEHIVVDGQTGINPFDIRPAAKHDQEATHGKHDQHRMKVSDCVDFFTGILRSNGIDPSDYKAVLEQAIQETYLEAGITADPETHSKPSPEPEDFFYVIKDMAENTEEYTLTHIDLESDKMQERLSTLLVELSGFKPGGKYHHLLSDTVEGISPDSEMVYIDMRQLAGRKDGGKSVNLQLAVSQLSQLIRQTQGRVIFMVDEAHNFLHSPELIDWLNKAAREWRRYNAILWLVTQSPREFVDPKRGEDESIGAKRLELTEQFAVKQLFDCGGVDDDVIEKFGVPPEHVSVVQDDLVAGDSDMDYTECLLSFHDEPGWLKTEVKVNPVHLSSITFSHRHGWSYKDRMRAALNEDLGGAGLPKDEDKADEIIEQARAIADGGEE